MRTHVPTEGGVGGEGGGGYVFLKLLLSLKEQIPP